MLQVKHLLAQKGGAVQSIDPDASVLDAIRKMAQHTIGALLVMRDDQLVGVISERDYARKVILKGHSSRETPVHDIMTSPAITVGPADTIETCMHRCTDQRVRHLPVIENGRVIGVVSLGDLVKAVIDEQSEQIEHLQRYIAG